MDSSEYVESFARGLAVIRAFGPGHRSLTLSDLAKRAGLQRASARRFVLTLCSQGYALQEGRHFSLTPRVLELGYAYLSSLEFPDMIQPHLTAITRQIGESSSAAVLDGAEIVYIARSAAPQRLMSVTLGIGSRLPSYATSMGLALLAERPDEEVRDMLERVAFRRFTPRTAPDLGALIERLGRIRALGYAVADQELEIGLRSLAIAIPGRSRRPDFAINVATNVARISRAELEARILPAMRAAALDCTATTRMLP